MSAPTASASTSSDALYELLVSLLLRFPQTIEILPGDGSICMHPQDTRVDSGAAPSLSPFLFVEGNLGIPQKILYKVYLHAACIFKSVRGRSRIISARQPMNIQPSYDLDDPLVLTLSASSSVLILANPSHQTALNARKRLVQANLIDPRAELRFMASLLSSQHCAKHAELWYHRRWLLAAIYDSYRLPDALVRTESRACQAPHRLRFPSREALGQELELTSRACELYSRNYFAWTHRLTCVRSLLSDYLVGTDPFDFITLLRHEVATVKEWIERHVSDYSAIHYILTIADAAFRSENSTLMEMVVINDLLNHAISLVQDYPAHESLWMYIRMALSISGSWKSQQAYHFMDDFVRPLANSQLSSALVSQYANQFLERSTGYNSEFRMQQAWYVLSLRSIAFDKDLYSTD